MLQYKAINEIYQDWDIVKKSFFNKNKAKVFFKT